MAEPTTHLEIDRSLCGEPIRLGDGEAVVDLVTTAPMAADARGLVHGGFLFGLADYAAMLAVNEPNVVLAAATTRFVKPVVVGDRVEARARRSRRDGAKSVVEVELYRGEEVVLSGEFRCYSPERHVLE